MTSLSENKSGQSGAKTGVSGNRSHRWAMGLLAVLVAGLLLTANAVMALYNRVHQPGVITVPRGVLRIEKGSTARSISHRFFPDTIDRRLFLSLAKTRHVDQSLKFGTYRVEKAMSISEFIDMLAEGTPADHVKVTLPEGYTMVQCAKELARRGIVAEDKFMAVATDPDVCTSLGIPAANLEGYLFPDTYFLVPNTSALDVVHVMVGRFRQVAGELRVSADSVSATELHDIVKIASIVEREAMVDSEKPLIAAVIYNRLDRGMRLQCDTTIRYGLNKYGRHLTYADLDADTPYNTYRYSGLPPTPICNPGRSALDAALRPADSNYLYFVSRNDGTHKFSQTLAEHNAAVHKYQKSMRTR